MWLLFADPKYNERENQGICKFSYNTSCFKFHMDFILWGEVTFSKPLYK